MAARESAPDETHHPLAGVRLVVVGSMNPVKVAAVRSVMARVANGIQVNGIVAESGVPAQPWGDAETLDGARARACAVLAAMPEAALGVGIEGGVVGDRASGALRTCAWAAVADRSGRVSDGGSLAMPLPASVARLVRAGMELGHAMDEISGARNSKHAGGAVGILTAGLVDRQAAYETIVTYALAPFLTPDFWASA